MVSPCGTAYLKRWAASQKQSLILSKKNDTMDFEKSENHINNEEGDSKLANSVHRSKGIEAVNDMLNKYSKRNATFMDSLV